MTARTLRRTGLAGCVLCLASLADAQTAMLFEPQHERYSVAEYLARRNLYRESLTLGRGHVRERGVDVNLAPVLDHVLEYVHAVGIPLRPAPELTDDHGVVFSASWRISTDMPALNLHIGDSGPLDAFYAVDGFRWSFTWPVPGAQRFALHLEGGDDSTFGHWGILGMQWRDRKRPLAIGIGVPVAMAGTHGVLGLLCELRLLLN